MNEVASTTHDDFDELVQRVCAGTADSAARRRLGELMEDDPTLQERFIDQVSVNEMLAERYSRDASPIALSTAMAEVEDDASPSLEVIPQAAWWRHGAVAAAAVVALLVTAGVLMLRGGDAVTETAADPTTDPDVVAIVADLRDAVWATDHGDELMDVGFKVTPGAMNLKSGSAQLLLDRGAAVTFIGPATFELTGDNACRLTQGRMLAHVPPSATGFTTETPAGVVRDIGTEFGLLVDAEGRAEVHVFKGEVDAEVRVGDGVERVRLRESEAIEMTDGTPPGAGRLPINAAPFVAATGSYRAAAYVYWPFDGEGSAAFQPRSSGFGSGPIRVTNGNTPRERIDTARLVEGRYGRGFRVGNVPGMNTDFPAITGDKPRTVALWIKAEPNTTGGLVGWGDLEKGRAWQVSLQWREQDGPMGRLRIGVNGGQVIGTKDLRDGKWHHIAVVYRGGDFVEGTRLYVDGRPERVSEAVTCPVDTSSKQSLFIGRHIGGSMNMRGLIDEVYVIDGALAPQQIRMLMEAEPSSQLFGNATGNGDAQ